MTQVTREFFKGLCKAIVLGARRGIHKMLYQHFQVMKTIRGGNPNVEPVSFGIDRVLEDFTSLIKK